MVEKATDRGACVASLSCSFQTFDRLRPGFGDLTVARSWLNDFLASQLRLTDRASIRRVRAPHSGPVANRFTPSTGWTLTAGEPSIDGGG